MPKTVYVTCPTFPEDLAIPRLFGITAAEAVEGKVDDEGATRGPPAWVMREYFDGTRETPQAFERLLLRLDETAVYPELGGYACVRPLTVNSVGAVARTVRGLDDWVEPGSAPLHHLGVGACDVLI